MSVFVCGLVHVWMHIRGDPVVRNLDVCVLGRFSGIVCVCMYVWRHVCSLCGCDGIVPDAKCPEKKLYPNSVLAHWVRSLKSRTRLHVHTQEQRLFLFLYVSQIQTWIIHQFGPLRFFFFFLELWSLVRNWLHTRANKTLFLYTVTHLCLSAHNHSLVNTETYLMSQCHDQASFAYLASLISHTFKWITLLLCNK